MRSKCRNRSHPKWTPTVWLQGMKFRGTKNQITGFAGNHRVCCSARYRLCAENASALWRVHIDEAKDGSASHFRTKGISTPCTNCVHFNKMCSANFVTGVNEPLRGLCEPVDCNRKRDACSHLREVSEWEAVAGEVVGGVAVGVQVEQHGARRPADVLDRDRSVRSARLHRKHDLRLRGDQLLQPEVVVHEHHHPQLETSILEKFRALKNVHVTGYWVWPSSHWTRRKKWSKLRCEKPTNATELSTLQTPSNMWIKIWPGCLRTLSQELYGRIYTGNAGAYASK